MRTTKRTLASASLLLLAALQGRANNLSITNMSVVGTNQVRFNISWDNSWFNASYNWDAVWVFLKAQDCSGSTTWDHVDLSTSAAAHTVTGGTGLIVEASSDGRGVFIRRNSVSGGTQSGTVTVQFATAMANAATVNFRVFGTEMVWVPQGNFSIGDGSNSATQSLAAFALTNITSEGAINFDAVRNDAAGPGSMTAHNAIPATFPKGWAGFYCMKYEISQQQYAAFLNALTLSQQFARTANPPTAAAGTLAMTNAANRNRSAIVVATPGSGTTTAVYATDLNGDGTFGDGDDIACNYLSWADLLAYLDWSGLRPMTEFEYEKAARGSGSPGTSEYAWGNNIILPALSTALTDPGTSSEIASVSGVGLCAHNGGSSTTLGPLRVGFAAAATPVRSWAGASFWGIMELSGNVWEQTVAAGCYNGSARIPGTYIFTGANGDGRLNMFSGDHDVTSWPAPGGLTNSAGTVVVRGGNWEYGAQRAQVSDRNFLVSTAENLNRTRRTGGRGVRRP